MKKILLIALLLIGLSLLWYFISPIFNTVEVNDEVPVAREPELMPSGEENLSPEQSSELAQLMVKANSETEEPMEEERPAEQPALSLVSEVMPTIGHPAMGTVRVIPTDEGQVIRFENFSTINGPELHLYLAKDLDAEEYIDLGPIRGTMGNINYLVSDDIDLNEYRYVMHWCVPFGVLFNYADLGVDDE